MGKERIIIISHYYFRGGIRRNLSYDFKFHRCIFALKMSDEFTNDHKILRLIQNALLLISEQNYIRKDSEQILEKPQSHKNNIYLLLCQFLN